MSLPGRRSGLTGSRERTSCGRLDPATRAPRDVSGSGGDVLGPHPILVILFVLGINGAVILSLLLLVHVFRRRRACYQERTVEVPLGLDEAFERALLGVSVLRSSPRVTVASRVAGRIEATVGMTLRSFGEVVTLSFTLEAWDRTTVRIASWSRLGTTLADHGKNRINVAVLSAVIHPPSRAPRAD
jgi:hypothetical protein